MPIMLPARICAVGLLFLAACARPSPTHLTTTQVARTPQEKAMLACAQSIALAEGFEPSPHRSGAYETRAGRGVEYLFVATKLSSDSVRATPSIRYGLGSRWGDGPITALGHRVLRRIETECRMPRGEIARAP